MRRISRRFAPLIYATRPNRIAYFADGTISALSHVEDFELSLPASDRILFVGQDVFFYPNGRPHYSAIANDVRLKSKDGSNISCGYGSDSGDAIAEFDTDGYAVQCLGQFPSNPVDMTYGCEL